MCVCVFVCASSPPPPVSTGGNPELTGSGRGCTVATGTREGAGSREVAAWDVPGAWALRGGPQAGLPVAGPPPGREEGCVARPLRWPGAGWLPPAGEPASLWVAPRGGGLLRRAPRGCRGKLVVPRHTEQQQQCVCVCVRLWTSSCPRLAEELSKAQGAEAPQGTSLGIHSGFIQGPSESYDGPRLAESKIQFWLRPACILPLAGGPSALPLVAI